MKLSPREMIIAWLTAAAVLIGLTVWLAEPKIEAYRQMSRQIEVAERKMDRDQNLIDTRDEWEDR
ncbi:MAG: hypothetical protein GX811_03265 [Lentisphaerae bacterium]|nr:hypothetical protein [Lentisphaerota bacterium]